MTTRTTMRSTACWFALFFSALLSLTRTAASATTTPTPDTNAVHVCAALLSEEDIPLRYQTHCELAARSTEAKPISIRRATEWLVALQRLEHEAITASELELPALVRTIAKRAEYALETGDMPCHHDAGRSAPNRFMGHPDLTSRCLPLQRAMEQQLYRSAGQAILELAAAHPAAAARASQLLDSQLPEIRALLIGRELRLRARRIAENDRFSSYRDYADSYDASRAALLALSLGTVADFADPRRVLRELQPQSARYASLVDGLARYRDLAEEGWPQHEELEVLEPGDSGPAVDALRHRLAAEGFATGTSNAQVYGDALQAALRAFQRSRQLAEDGRVGPGTLRALRRPPVELAAQLHVSLRQLRRSPARFSETRAHLRVNIPSQHAVLVDNAQQSWRFMTVVGRRTREGELENPNATPVLSADLTRVVLNPSWYVPQRIFRESLYPRYGADPERLRRAGYELLSGEGRDALVRQLPGPENGLGIAKFLFYNPQSIYLHDSPGRYRFTLPRRAVSHGCVRVSDARELSIRLLRISEGSSDEAAAEEVDEILNAGRERVLDLSEELPVHLEYVLAEESEDIIVFHRNIYRRDGDSLARALAYEMNR